MEAIGRQTMILLPADVLVVKGITRKSDMADITSGYRMLKSSSYHPLFLKGKSKKAA